MRSYALVLAAGAAAAALVAATPSLAQSSGAVPQLQAGLVNPAFERLLQNARHSIRNGQAPLAHTHLDRVLNSDPTNAEAMMLRVVAFATEEGKQAQAESAYAQLRATHPNDADRLLTAERALQTDGQSGVTTRANAALSAVSTDADNRIEAARQASGQGRYDEAVGHYRAAFGGKGKTPPDELALEFYQTLAGTKSGISEARKGLKRIYEERRDPRIGLVYAQVLTYRESTRRDGIDRLESLSSDANPQIQAEAADSWGKALTWLGGKKSDLPRYDRYLARFSNDDSVVSARSKAVSNIKKVADGRRQAGRRDRYGEARAEGFRALDRGDRQKARERFEYALRGNKRDADSLGGIGVILLQEGQFDAARDYLSRASQRSKRSRARWSEALASAEFWSTYHQALSAYNRNEFAQAETIARGLPQRGGQDGKAVNQLLGDSLNAQGRYAEAESAFRSALNDAPGDPGVELGLFTALTGQNRGQEAFALSQQMSPESRSQLGDIGGLQVTRWQTEADLAFGQGDDRRAYDLYSQVLSRDPRNPWASLGLARVLARNGNVEQAFNLVDGLKIDPEPERQDEMLFAAAVFYDEQGRTAEAATIASQVRVEALPNYDNAQAKAREFQSRTNFVAQVESARALGEAGGKEQAARRLETLASQATTPAETAQIASALAEVGQSNRALRLVRRQISKNGGLAGNPALAVQYAGALAQSGQDAEASAVLMRTEQQNLTPQQRIDVQKIRSGMALTQADRARQRGAFADAYDLIYPHLAVNPQDAELLGGLARIYADAGQYREAQTIYAQMLELEPGNLTAIRGAVGAAISARDISTASVLLDQAVRAHPTDPEVYYLVGEAARARGDIRTARDAYKTAKHLRQQELASKAAHGGAILEETLPPNPFNSIGQPRGSFATPNANGFGGQPGNYQVQPNPAYNPFDQSSIGEDVLKDMGGADTMIGDGSGDNLLLAQAAPGQNASGYQTYGANSRLMEPEANSSIDVHQPTSLDVYLPAFVNPAEGAQYQDETLTDRIDDRLNELNDQRVGGPSGHFVQGGVQLRSRDGDAGLDQMTEVQTPLSYSFTPGEVGTFSFTAAPNYISAGKINNDEAQLRRFGRNPLVDSGAVTSPGDISDSGIGLNAAFDAGWVKADVGVTPLGFLFTSPVGGLSFEPQLSEAVTLRFSIEQRAVTDSVMSYAGVKDTRNGVTFGGVVKRGGKVGIAIDTGDFGTYANAGFYQYEGNRVEDNQSIEGSLGAYIRIINRPDEELKIGGNVTFFGFEENLRHFTLGHGGYFSPQSYFSVSAPIEYTRREGPMSYQVGGSIGIQRFDEDTVDIFPGQAGNTNLLFQRLNAVGNPLGATAITQYQGQEETSIGFSAYGRVEYAVSEATSVGAGARFDSAADWFEGTAFLFLRQSLGGDLYNDSNR